MKHLKQKDQNKSMIFARIRTNDSGLSQSFTTTEAALTWIETTTRELEESGYTRVDFTIQGEYHSQNRIKAQFSNSICNELNIRINNAPPQKTKEMEESKKDLSAEFFSTAESDIKTIAAATMEAAISSKELSDSEFESAIADASNGMVTLRRSVNNPNRVDFCFWEAYTATHAPRDPGKKPLEAIGKTIIATYMLGQSRTSASLESDASKSEISINNVLTSGCHNNTTVDELIANIICTIHTHMLDDVNVKAYLCCHSAGVEAEISAMTGGTIKCTISDTEVTLSCSNGVTCSVTIEDKALDAIDQELRAILIRLLIFAGLSPHTRDAIACIIDMEAFADMSLVDVSTTGYKTESVSAAPYTYSLF